MSDMQGHVYIDGKRVEKGDIIKDFRGKEWRFRYARGSHIGVDWSLDDSTSATEFYTSVFNAKLEP